jgi:hypothetical protein
MPKYNFDNVGGSPSGRATKMGAEVKGGRITRPAADAKPKYKKASRQDANAPLETGRSGKYAALGNMSARAREIAEFKAIQRRQNKAKGLPANAGMTKIERAQGSTKKMTLAKAEPRYQSKGGNSSGGYLQKITNDMEKR